MFKYPLILFALVLEKIFLFADPGTGTLRLLNVVAAVLQLISSYFTQHFVIVILVYKYSNYLVIETLPHLLASTGFCSSGVRLHNTPLLHEIQFMCTQQIILKSHCFLHFVLLLLDPGAFLEVIKLKWAGPNTAFSRIKTLCSTGSFLLWQVEEIVLFEDIEACFLQHFGP